MIVRADRGGAPPQCAICGHRRFEPYPTPFPDSLWECRHCGARCVHPTPARLEDRYESEHASGKWDELFDRTPVSDTVLRAEAFTGIVGGTGRLLDVGFGDGRFLDAALDLGWDTWGLEVSATAARGVDDRHRVVVGGLEAFAQGDRFDAVTFWDVLEHVPDPSLLIRDARRLLVPGGVLAISMPNLRGTEALTMGRRWRYYEVSQYGHLHHLGPDHLLRLLVDAGFEPIAIRTRGSVDLRDLLHRYGEGAAATLGRAVLDKVSGLLARVAVPMNRGNTLMAIGKKPDARGA